jgi:hypothetical protein
MPPEAPEEGQNSRLSNLLGAKFFRKRISMWSLLVSWKQKIFAPHSSILFLRRPHLSLSLSPLTFQHKIFQFLFIGDQHRGKTTSKEAKPTRPPKQTAQKVITEPT